MTSALNTMKSNVDSACSAIKSSVTSYLSMGSDAYQWGRDICIEMAAGINAEAWRVEQAAARLAAAVDDTLGFSVPEEGPLSHADEYMPDFMELMAKGIRDSGKLVMQSVRELSASMGGGFHKPLHAGVPDGAACHGRRRGRKQHPQYCQYGRALCCG